MVKIKSRNSNISRSIVTIAKFEQILQFLLQFVLMTLSM